MINGIINIRKLDNPDEPIGKISLQYLAIQLKYVMRFIQRMLLNR